MVNISINVLAFESAGVDTTASLDYIEINPERGKYNVLITVNSSGADGGDVDNVTLMCGNITGVYNLCNSTWGSPERSCNFNSPWVDDALHTIYCVVKNTFNNTSPERNAIFTADNTAPITLGVLNVEGDTDAKFWDTDDDSNTVIQVNLNETGAACRYSSLDINYSSMPPAQSCSVVGSLVSCNVWNLVGGQINETNVSISCIDMYNNEQNSTQNIDVVFGVDWTEPSINTDNDGQIHLPGYVINLSVNDQPPGTIVYAKYCNDTIGTCEPYLPFNDGDSVTFDQRGTWYLKYNASDEAGNYNETKETIIFINQMPAVSAQVYSYQAPHNIVVNITVLENDSSQSVVCSIKHRKNASFDVFSNKTMSLVSGVSTNGTFQAILSHLDGYFIGQALQTYVSCYDGMEFVNSTFNSTIMPNIKPILLVDVPDVYMKEDTPSVDVFDLDNYFNDPDGDMLTYTSNGSHIFSSFDGDNNVTFLSTPQNWYGFEYIQFRANDSSIDSNTSNIVNVTVYSVPDIQLGMYSGTDYDSLAEIFAGDKYVKIANKYSYIYNSSYTTINFSDKINFTRDINISDVFVIKRNYVSANTTAWPEINKSAIITFNQLDEIYTDEIYIIKDGIRCDHTNLCDVIEWNKTTKTVIINVTSFSTYWIANSQTLPNVTTPNITPSPAYANDTLSCITNVTDVEQELVNVSFTWYVNGVYNSTWDTTVTCNTTIKICHTNVPIDSSYLTKFDNFTCSVQAYDGINYSVPKNNSQVISNYIPVFDFVLTDQSINHTENLTYDINCSDPVDFDTLYYYDNTSLFDIDINNGSIVDDPTVFDTGQHSILITCGDNWDNSTNSFNYEVKDVAPVVTNVILNSTDIGNLTTGNLTVYHTYSDYEGDTEQGIWIKWYINASEQTNLENFTVVLEGNTSKHEVWWVRIAVFDGAKWSAFNNSNNVTIRNTAPVFDFSLGKQSLNHTENLTYDINCSDNDGDVIIYYDNTTLFSINASTGLIKDNPTVFETGEYAILIICSDGEVNVTGNFVYEINDSTPYLTNVLINSTDPGNRTNGSLMLNYVFNDFDNDSEIDREVIWYKGDVVQPALENQTVVLSENTTRDDVWVARVKVFDGAKWSDVVNSTSITIENSVLVFSPDLVNQSVYHNTNLVYDINCTDNDGDVKYFDNTSLFDINLDTGLIVDNPSQVETGIYAINITCTSEGDTETVSQVFFYTILNRYPNATNVRLVSDDLLNRTNGTLIASFTYNDADGDAKQDQQIIWYKNDVPQAGLENRTSIENYITTKHENWSFSLRVYDGLYWSNYTNSTTLTIKNSKPTHTYPRITPDPVLFDYNLTCYNQSTNDNDEDSVTNYYMWYVNDTLVWTASNYLIFDNFSIGDNITCQVIPFDGEENGTALNTTVEATNGEPTFSTVLVNPAAGKLNTNITLTTINAIDYEGDDIQLRCGDSPGVRNLCNSTFGQPERSCSFYSPWNDNEIHAIYCVVVDATDVSLEKTVTFIADNLAPIISTSNLSDIAGDSIAPYWDVINDGQTALTFNFSEPLLRCRWSTTDTNYNNISSSHECLIVGNDSICYLGSLAMSVSNIGYYVSCIDIYDNENTQTDNVDVPIFGTDWRAPDTYTDVNESEVYVPAHDVIIIEHDLPTGTNVTTYCCLDQANVCVPNSNCDDGATGQNNITIPVAIRGTNFIRYYSIDGAGNNQSLQSKNVTINSLPVIAAQEYFNYTKNHIFSVIVNASDVNEQTLKCYLQHRLAGEIDYTTKLMSLTSLIASNGTFAVNISMADGYTPGDNIEMYVNCSDGLENSSTALTRNMLPNNAPAVPTLISPVNETITNSSPILFNYSSNDVDTIDNLTYYIIADTNRSPTTVIFVTPNTSYSWTPIENRYYWKIIVSDGFSNTTSDTKTFLLDTSSPVTTDNVSNWYDYVPTVIGLNATDNLAGINYTRYCVTDANSTCDPINNGTYGTEITILCGVNTACQKIIRYYSFDNANNQEIIEQNFVYIQTAGGVVNTTEAVNCTIYDYTNMTNSVCNDSVKRRSLIINSFNYDGTYVENSTEINSTLKNVDVFLSQIFNSSVSDSYLYNMTLYSANVTDNKIINGTIGYLGINYTSGSVISLLCGDGILDYPVLGTFETCSSCPADLGPCPTTPTGGGGGPSRRGGGAFYGVGLECIPIWTCEPWGECVFGLQNRTCKDTHRCRPSQEDLMSGLMYIKGIDVYRTETQACEFMTKEKADLDVVNTSRDVFLEKEYFLITINGEEHKIVVSKVYKKYVDLIIYSSEMHLNINIGESVDLDLDEDGTNDLRIILEDIVEGKAIIRFEKIKIVLVEEKPTLEEVSAISDVEKYSLIFYLTGIFYGVMLFIALFVIVNLVIKAVYVIYEKSQPPEFKFTKAKEKRMKTLREYKLEKKVKTVGRIKKMKGVDVTVLKKVHDGKTLRMMQKLKPTDEEIKDINKKIKLLSMGKGIETDKGLEQIEELLKKIKIKSQEEKEKENIEKRVKQLKRKQKKGHKLDEKEKRELISLESKVKRVKVR